MLRKKSLLLLGLFLILLLAATGAFAEVRVFVSKNTVKVYDPVLKTHSVLNSFMTQGWRTHNNLALVWDAEDVQVYDIRTHQWTPLQGFSAVSGLLSENLAVVWEKNRLAVYDARQPGWIVSPVTLTSIQTEFISGGMAAALTEGNFVVYDPVLHKWCWTEEMEVFEAVLGDNLAACWNNDSVFVYDTTLHQWVDRDIEDAQAAVVEDYRLSVFTADHVYAYDAMNHRWSSKER